MSSRGFVPVLVAAIVATVSHGLSIEVIAQPAAAACPPLSLRAPVPIFAAALVPGLPAKMQQELANLTSGDDWFQRYRRGAVTTVKAVEMTPLSGPAPLEVEVVCIWCDRSVTVHVDPGDGSPALSNVGSPSQLTFGRPGTFPVTTRMVNATGNVLTHTESVLVVSLTEFKAELHRRWSGLGAAVLRGDVLSALECIRTLERDKLKVELTRLAGLPAAEKQARFNALVDLNPHQPPDRLAGGMLWRRVPEGWLPIDFGPDFDGVWRITSFH